MKSNTPPKPPTPPENKSVCSCCGYYAPQTEYELNHKFCWTGIALSISLLSMPVGVLIFLIFKIVSGIISLS